MSCKTKKIYAILELFWKCGKAGKTKLLNEALPIDLRSQSLKDNDKYHLQGSGGGKWLGWKGGGSRFGSM